MATQELTTKDTENLSITGSDGEQEEVRKMFIASLEAIYRICVTLRVIDDIEIENEDETLVKVMIESCQTATSVLLNTNQLIPKKLGIDVSSSRKELSDIYKIVSSNRKYSV